MKPQAAPKSILFVCYLNSIRSPMAEGLMRKLFPNAVSQSCGMASGDLDDLMIAFTEAAGDAAKAAFEGTNTSIEVWPLPDPTQGSLDVRAIMNNYRAIRENIEARLKRAFVE